MNQITTTESRHQELYIAFEKFILEDFHPCLMARSVFKNKQVDFHVYDSLGEDNTAKLILSDLENYIEVANKKDNNYYSFIAAFPTEIIDTEVDFEDKLWTQLQLLHQFDAKPWDSNVSKNPEDQHFSFSILGHAFYLVGMHPNSSRMARRAPCVSFAFNLHSQFEKLRQYGKYHDVRDNIRERDISLQGSINPMLDDFGHSSEARQYSGRAVEENWKCPFNPKTNS